MTEFQWPKADWGTWAHMPKATLREAVLLSVDLEPRPPVLMVAQCEPSKRYAEPGYEFDHRLTIASAHVDAAGPLHPLGYMPLLNGPADATVSLREFAAWAICLGWNLPEHFPDALDELPTPAVTAPETKEQRQDRRLRMCLEAGLKMPRSAVGRFPEGVGAVAQKEGVSRQTLSADVKAALTRKIERERPKPRLVATKKH